jgi:hypothetical protein
MNCVIGIAALTIFALLIVGYCALVVSGDIAQREEDDYGVDQARRS